MKAVRTFDSDYEALKTLSKVYGCDLKATISNLVNIGIKTSAAQIAVWRVEQVGAKKTNLTPRAKKLVKKGSADEQALALAKVKGKICCADIQRTLCLSYNTATRILNRLINAGVVVQGATNSTWVWHG